MEAPMKVRQVRQDMPFKTNHPQNKIYFYRFVGGNPSETEKLVRELDQQKGKHELLIGMFRFPFRFEGKKRTEIASIQYFRMKELCDAVIVFRSDDLLKMVDEKTPIHEAYQTFRKIEDYTILSLQKTIDLTGEINIDFQDVVTFIKRNPGPMFIHTVEGSYFNEPLKYLISSPYLPDDFTDGKQLIINIGYTRSADLDAFRQINLRLNDLFSKADIFKIGSYLIDEPGEKFRITLLVNGIDDPVKMPEDYKKLPKYRGISRMFGKITNNRQLARLFKN